MLQCKNKQIYIKQIFWNNFLIGPEIFICKSEILIQKSRGQDISSQSLSRKSYKKFVSKP